MSIRPGSIAQVAETNAMIATALRFCFSSNLSRKLVGNATRQQRTDKRLKKSNAPCTSVVGLLSTWLGLGAPHRKNRGFGSRKRAANSLRLDMFFVFFR